MKFGTIAAQASGNLDAETGAITAVLSNMWLASAGYYIPMAVRWTGPAWL